MAFKLIALLVTIATADNCFYNDHLTYVYDLPDYSGNYTSVKEYYLRMTTMCDFIQDTDCKLTWYSSDISAEYQMYWDNNDGQGCRAEGQFIPYPHDTQIIMGEQPMRNNVIDSRIACLVKFQIDNRNTISDMRLQIFNMGPSGLKAIQVVAAGALFTLSLISSVL